MRSSRHLLLMCFAILPLLCDVGNCNSQTPRQPYVDPASSFPILNSAEVNSMGFASMLLVGLVDGSISAFSAEDDAVEKFSGPLWKLESPQGPLISSCLSEIELMKNGAKLQLIPALDGSLYSFDGERIENLPVSAETLLSSSFKISEDVSITGGKETFVDGIDVASGKIKYSCGIGGCKRNFADTASLGASESKGTLLISRLKQTVRAFDVHQGWEKWNFSVAHLDLALADGLDAKNKCLKSKEEQEKLGSRFRFDVATGIIQAVSADQRHELWHYKFQCPITNVWVLDGSCIQPLNLVTFVTPLLDSTFRISDDFHELIFLGHYEEQLFIQKADPRVQLHKYFPEVDSRPLLLNAPSRTPAIAEAYRPLLTEDHPERASTELVPISPADYPFEGGYFVALAERNPAFRPQPLNGNRLPDSSGHLSDTAGTKPELLIYLLNHWLEACGLLVIPLLVGVGIGGRKRKRTEKAIVTELVDPSPSTATAPVLLMHQASTKSTESAKSILSLQSQASSATGSRFCADFEVIEKLGKGGFGVVYLAKNKLDESLYAVKKIKLPRSETAREKVRREVRVMAKLNHPGIVRFYNAWIEACDPVPVVASGFSSETEEEFSQVESATSASAALSVELCQDWIGTRRKLTSPDSQDSLRYVPKSSDSQSDNVVFEAEDSSGVSTSPQRTRKKRTSSASSKKSTPSLSGMSDLESDEDDEAQEAILPSAPKPVPQLFIQMELCRRETLKDWLKLNTESRHRTHILDIFYQIVSAVEYIHKKGMMHRDLKPSNILFSVDGTSVKIADFGLVASMDDEEAQHSVMPNHNYLSVQNHTNQVGTTLYMSPELLTGKAYDEKVDIYSLGLIFFELLVPFKTEMERVYSINAVKTGKLSSLLVPSCSERLDENLLNELLDVKPSNRPTAGQIIRSNIFKELIPVKSSHSLEEELSDGYAGRRRTFSVNDDFDAFKA